MKTSRTAAIRCWTTKCSNKCWRLHILEMKILRSANENWVKQVLHPQANVWDTFLTQVQNSHPCYQWQEPPPWQGSEGEDVILSLTVDGPAADARTICFQPGTTKLKTGDEQSELYPSYSRWWENESFLRSCNVEDTAITYSCHNRMHGHYIP